VDLDVVGESFEAYWGPRSSEPLVISDGELLDWAENHMEWSDVAAHAKCVSVDVDPVDYGAGWTHGPKAIVEVER
jgi:hypothetical protein